MTDQVFTEKLSQAQTPEALAELANELIEDSLGKKVTALKAFLKQFDLLLDKGLDPNVLIEGNSCIDALQYGYSPYHLDAAKMVFERYGLPTVLGDMGLSFIQEVRAKLDYNYYDSEFVTKLYLLCCAYDTSGEETGLTFSDKLYPEMFHPFQVFISAYDLEEDSVSLTLSPAIFKDIHRFDHAVEMEEQKEGYFSCWRLHIFDKKTKIEVAVYH